MLHDEHNAPSRWSEEDSQTFLDYGRYFVPEREAQIAIVCELAGPCEGSSDIIELCCGEGWLAEALLERYPQATVYGYDGSPAMLKRAAARLERFGERFITRQFDLADSNWHQSERPARAVVSSLAIHHLGGPQKQALFRKVCTMLEDGGRFVIADLIAPADARGTLIAAQSWDEAVRRRAMLLDGDLRAFETFRNLNWNMYRLPEPEPGDTPSPLFDQLRWLEQAGFEHVDVYWMQAGHTIFGGSAPLRVGPREQP